MSVVSPAVPSFSTFVRDQLAEYLDGLGHDVTAQDERDGFPCLTVETWDGATWDDVAVLADGRTFSMVDGWREVTLRGFTWAAESTDTGAMHGPAIASLYCPRCSRLTSGNGSKPRQWQPHRCASCVASVGHRVSGTTRTV